MTNVREICSYFVDLKDKNKISADVSEYQIFKSLKKQKKNTFSLVLGFAFYLLSVCICYRP